jgi:hypothetical protein
MRRRKVSLSQEEIYQLFRRTAVDARRLTAKQEQAALLLDQPGCPAFAGR